jgi:hypothetical protein
MITQIQGQRINVRRDGLNLSGLEYGQELMLWALEKSLFHKKARNILTI